jgi:hypothetical protein
MTLISRMFGASFRRVVSSDIDLHVYEKNKDRRRIAPCKNKEKRILNRVRAFPICLLHFPHSASSTAGRVSNQPKYKMEGYAKVQEKPKSSPNDPSWTPAAAASALRRKRREESGATPSDAAGTPFADTYFQSPHFQFPTSTAGDALALHHEARPNRCELVATKEGGRVGEEGGRNPVLDAVGCCLL